MTRAQEYIQKVKALSIEYHAVLDESDNYDQNEEVCGTSYNIIVDGKNNELIEVLL
jgi:hypothetical protein